MQCGTSVAYEDVAAAVGARRVAILMYATASVHAMSRCEQRLGADAMHALDFGARRAQVVRARLDPVEEDEDARFKSELHVGTRQRAVRRIRNEARVRDACEEADVAVRGDVPAPGGNEGGRRKAGKGKQ
eukprot:6210217-Pleurochrysis_carterae.AAC.2